MNVTDNVRRAFRSKYFFDVQPTWLHACLAWLRNQFQLTDLTNSYTLEKIYNQWLHTDLALIADACCLPSDLDLNAKKVQLTGRYALQINSILCISEPYYSQAMAMHGDQNDNERIDTDTTDTQQWKPPPPKRVLYLELTDGKTILRGLEYEPINGLDRDTTLPGAKILVSGPVFFRRGMLLLTTKNTQVLGGYAESLLDQNSSIETSLRSLSKTASNLEESRMRFHRLNIKVHAQMAVDDSTSTAIPDRPTNPTVFRADEDEMDAYIRQAYADGVINDDSHIAPDPTDYDPPPPPLSSSYHTTQLLTTTSSRIPFSADDPDELILVSDDDDARSSYVAMPSSSPPFSYDQSARSSSTLLPPPPPPPPPTIKISLPYTYLSLIRQEMLSSIVDSQDFLVKGCFASIVANPRVVKNEFDLEVILNDGSDCIQVRLAPEFLNQHLGMTAMELMARRKACQTEVEKKKLQTDFNERLKQFGHGINLVNATMTIVLSQNELIFLLACTLNENRRFIAVIEETIILSSIDSVTEDSTAHPGDQHLKHRMQTSSPSTTVNLNTSETFSIEQLHVLPNSNVSISFRFLRPGDQVEVKSLCCDWFPIEYPDKWYDDVVHDTKYFALAACEAYSQRIIGLVVADILPLGSCNREDQQILHRSFPLTTPVCYILILGVVKEYRRQGLAGILLQQLLSMLYKRATCKAVYLHVLHSNKQAIQFYQSRNFQYRVHLPYYYCIKGENFDGYCFANYINGGYPPFTLSDFFSNWWTLLSGTSACRLLSRFGHFVVERFIFLDAPQRTSSYKQISRII